MLKIKMGIKEFHRKHERKFMIVFIILLYILPYQLVANLSSRKVIIYHLYTTIDGFIPLIPLFVIIYLSIYALVFLPSILVKEKNKFYNGSLTYFLVMVLSYFIFYLFPVQMMRPELAVDSISSSLLNFVYQSDLALNCFPSLHTSMAILAGLISYNYDKKYWWMLLWGILIAISTVFVKQHYFIDMVAGALMAIIGYLLYRFLNNYCLEKGKKIYKKKQ